MTPFAAYKRLKKACPHLEFSITTRANSNHFTSTIYVTEEWNDLNNAILKSNSFDKKDPVGICFKEIMQKLQQNRKAALQGGNPYNK